MTLSARVQMELEAMAICEMKKQKWELEAFRKEMMNLMNVHEMRERERERKRESGASWFCD